VEFHKGKLIYGTLRGRRVLAMNGRFHFYEGYAMDQVAFPVRVMKQLGIEILLISNAAGAMNLNWKKGDLMLINDHINLLPSNPLIGKNIDELGPRFPDMSEAYDKKFLEKMSQLAQQLNILLRSGVYVAVPGSMLETPAEYRFLRRIGGDAVGMSTVPEVIVARHMGMRVLAISVLTDECDPDNLKPVDITEIIAVAGKAEQKLSTLFSAFVENLDATTSIN
jgi:purine-nucleoside phosphorylase